MSRQLLQLRGDPSIRQFLFSQSRTETSFDTSCMKMMDRIEDLFRFDGAFHVQIDLSTCQVMIWLLDDPFNYKIVVGEELFDKNAWPPASNPSYPDNAQIRPDQIRPVLERFKELRFGDDKVYLRSGSINIMNGCLRLNFSCDGTHYVDHREFLTSSKYQV